MKTSHWLLIFLVIFSLLGTTACSGPAEKPAPPDEAGQSLEDSQTTALATTLDPQVVGVNPTLFENYESFSPPSVIKVTEGVYVARGYNRDNPALIEGEEGLIIVDPGESINAAQIVKDAFNEELDNIFDKKAVKAIIYTHSHDCHIHGASVFADKETEIIAHEALMSSLFDEWYSPVYPSRVAGGAMMGGSMFQTTPARDNQGWYSGYVLAGTNINGPSGFIPPTITVTDKLETTIAGVKLNLIAAPGETQDIIVVWLPDKKTLIEIGLIYEAFPALTTMRGSRQRDALDYVDSLKMCRGLNPEYLVALHGPNPVTVGADNIQEFLTNFSDAIQFMNDQTIYYMNQGYTAAEMMDLIELPPHLASNAYLKETYGSKDWNITHLFRYYRGYYSGQTRDLFPQSTESEAEMSAMLAGGIDKLVAKAEESRKEGQLEWALRLADDVLVLDPDNTAAFETKKATMLALAEETMNGQARNMLLSEYLIMTDQDQLPFSLDDPQAIFAKMSDVAVELMPMDTLHRIMSVNLNASKAMETDLVAGLQLTDSKENDPNQASHYTLNVRKGILEVDPPDNKEEQFELATDMISWKELVLNKLSPQDAITNGTVTITRGTAENFYTFMDLFDPSDKDR